METGMSQKELKRVEVIALRRSGQITQAEAARRLGLSERQVRRLEGKVALKGAKGVRSVRRGRPSNRRLAAQTVTRVSTLIRTHYRDFGPTLATEYLADRHGIALCKETVRQIMITAKLWRPQRGAKARIYALRERRPRFGELIQIDGSSHAWFEGRAARCCLVVFIDDATSRLTSLRFVAQECTLGYMHALYDHIQRYGMPMELYSDRHGIFRVNIGEARDDMHSQFGRALATLGIGSICANSPQAKGRVERANGVLQDRLIKALRLAGIDTIDAANAWLPSFVLRHNARFAIEPFDARDAHVPHAAADDTQLRRTLAKHYPRKLSNTLSCQFHSTLLQIQPSIAGGATLRGAAVIVLEHFDHSHQVLWRNAILPHTALQKVRVAPLEQGRKEVSAPRKSPPPAVQSRAHPWNKFPYGKLSPEFIAKR
jgi:Winged helix-turn helix